MTEIRTTHHNWYLIGFMGTGKSAVGQLLSERLQWPLIDVDQAIEAQAGRTIADIFSKEGEPYFRQLEKKFIEEQSPEEDTIVSCGGGLPVQPGMLEILKARGKVIAFFATPETIYERVRDNEDRPLLAVEDPLARIRELLTQRESIYRQADVCIETDGCTIDRIVDEVIAQCLEE